jgi:3-dehydroquinate synthase
MCAAAWVSTRLGYISEQERGRIIATIRAAGLPTGGLKLAVETVIEEMASDKKVKDGKIRLVLLEKIGKAVVRDDVPMELIREGIESLK